MIRLMAVLGVLWLVGCATQQEKESGMEQAIRDYIEIHQLEELKSLRSSNTDHWEELSNRFVIYSARQDVYLIEFARDCYELDQYPVVADVRRETNIIRARFDTLRGCPIAKIFALNENDVAELTALGQPVDSGN